MKRIDLKDKVFCICGAEMEMVNSSVVDWSELGCYWLRCSDCGRQSTPAITEYETKLYWKNFKVMFGYEEVGYVNSK